MKVHAKLKYLRISPRKVRLVADLIRGLNVKVAQNQLEFMNKRAAKPMLKLLNSAIANAKNNFKLKEDGLYISELKVDEGQTAKRWMPRAMGRATPINKRSSHITIVLNKKLEAGGKKGKTESLKHLSTETRKQENKKIDKDVKVVKSLDEVKELDKKEEKIAKDKEKPDTEEHKAEPFDARREGGDRHKQHLDKIRKKERDGGLKRMFRRKSV